MATIYIASGRSQPNKLLSIEHVVNECTKVQNPWCHDFMHAFHYTGKSLHEYGKQTVRVLHRQYIYSVYPLRKPFSRCASPCGNNRKKAFPFTIVPTALRTYAGSARTCAVRKRCMDGLWPGTSSKL